MKLPNGKNAHVPLLKLTDYLLSTTHPVGKSKAEFFRGLGFDDTNVAMLQQGLLAIGRDEDIVSTTVSTHGMKYVIEGTLRTPRLRLVSIRTVWIVELDDPQPRFITAYPA